MNPKRIAALLRELADAIEEPERVRPKVRKQEPLPREPKPETVAAVRRALRSKGVAA